MAAARQKGIPVSNVPEYSTRSVAQFVFALLLELCQHVAKHAAAVTAGEWTSQPDFSLRKTPLMSWPARRWESSALAGSAGKWREIARAFGMTVLASTSFARAAIEARTR